MSKLLKPYNDRMMEVLLYIQRNLDGDLAPETLAKVACFSVAHFHRIFKGMVGESLKEHVRRLRLERAAYKLYYSDLPIMDIALDAGFESPETFSRAFKKRFHVPPSTFRANFRTIISPDGNGKVHFRPDPSTAGFTPNNSPSSYEVEIRNREETKVIFVRHVGSYFDVEKAWDKLCEWAISNQLINEDTQYIGLCYDDPEVTPQGKIRYDACIDIVKDVNIPEDMGIQHIPAGQYAVATHYGPYDGLLNAYRELYGKWLPQSGYHPVNTIASFEKYIRTSDDMDSEDLVTEIWLAIEQPKI